MLKEYGFLIQTSTKNIWNFYIYDFDLKVTDEGEGDSA